MSRSQARFLLALCLSSAPALVSSAAAAGAQTAAPTITISPDRPFTVEEAIALGLSKSFGLQLQNITLENAKDNIEGAKAAIFDPSFSFQATRSTTQQVSSTNRLDGAATPRSATTSYNVSANIPKIPWTNGSASISMPLSRNASNSANDTFNPRYSNSVSLSINQPLFAQFGQRRAMQALDRARIQFKISTLQYRINVLNTINQIETAYYDLVGQREQHKIRLLTLDAAQRLFNENTAKRSSGMMTDLDVLNAEVGVGTAKNAVLTGEQSMRNSEENLLNLINAPNMDIRIGPVAFDDYRDGQPNYAQSYKIAREFYPQRLNQEEQIKLAEMTLYFARKDLQPDITLTGGLGYQARTVNTGFLDALENLPKDHGNNWSIGLRYNVVLFQRADKLAYRNAANAVATSKIQLEQIEANLQLAVRRAVRAIESNLLQVENATRTTEQSVRQYDLQKARFEAGLATAFLVLQTQEALERARINELSAKLALRIAVSTLRQLEGTSLERFRVTLPE